MGDRKPKSKKPSDLNESDFLGIVMQLVIKVDNKGLSDIQKILVNGFRQDLTYAEIAEKNYLNSENLRKEANKKLFPLISKALTEAMKTPIEVQKTNFITLIEHWNAIDNKGISVENSFVKSKTKINIFTELKNNLSGQQQSELNRIIKSYLPDNDNANFEKIIDKNMTIPCRKTKSFTTVENNQRRVRIHVLQGENPKALENTSLAMFDLIGIMDASAGIPQIDVTFQINADGMVKVSAKDVVSGREQKIVVQSSSGLTDEQIKGIIEKEKHRIAMKSGS